MSRALLTVLVVVPTWMVVVALFMVMWREHRSAREAGVAIAASIVLSAWAALASTLAARGFFSQPVGGAPPPVGINLVVVLAGLVVALAGSASLRRLLANQRSLILLNVWRLVGAVFLLLMAGGQMPALWALPAGIGDVLIGVTAPWVASKLDDPGGRRRAIIFNLLGLADLVVAVGLGVTTSRGPAQLFHTTPTADLATQFPLALVPTFLVPLAFMLHVVSLWQLLRGSWAKPRAYQTLTRQPA